MTGLVKQAIAGSIDPLLKYAGMEMLKQKFANKGEKIPIKATSIEVVNNSNFPVTSVMLKAGDLSVEADDSKELFIIFSKESRGGKKYIEFEFFGLDAEGKSKMKAGNKVKKDDNKSTLVWTVQWVSLEDMGLLSLTAGNIDNTIQKAAKMLFAA